MSTGTDGVRRFLVEQQDLRGQFVRLTSAWLALREHTDYPPAVRDLLGEAIAAAVLLASTLKFEGTLTLQLQGDGAVRLLVAQCTHDFQIRGVARFDSARVAEAGTDFAALAGQGSVAVTIDAERDSARYQGVVPIDGASLSNCLEHYFANSEQLPTSVRLASDAAALTGLLVQRMPSAGGNAETLGAESRLEASDAAYAAARETLAAIGNDELQARSAEELVHRCLPEHDQRLLEPEAVRFQCRCSPARVTGMLRGLGEDEVRSVLEEQGAVTVTCEFCQRPYRFDAIDVQQMFAEPVVRGSDAIN